MENEKVSVIVPVYNVEPYLPRCVDSILSQTYKNLEIILVDDGSPDNCGAICDAYAAKDSRIRVIHQENGGLSAARNAGLNIADGEYIAFVDSDDWISPDMIEKMLSEYSKTGADLVICNLQPVYESDYTGAPKQESPLQNEILHQAELIEHLMQAGGWYYCVAWNKLYRKETLKGISFPAGYIHEDEAIAHRVFERCRIVAVIAKPMYYYRQRSDGIMATGFSAKSTDVLSALADRLSCARANKWNAYEKSLVLYYEGKLWEWYHQFSGDPRNEMYTKRMEQSLKQALPSILKSREIPASHKLYLTVLSFHPGLFRKLYGTIRKIKDGRESKIL